MTLTVNMFTSEDQGAPAWDGTFQGFVDVLTACLVDGYGDTSPAGWTQPHSDSTRAAFKNNESDGGSGCFVYIEQHDSNYIRAKACSDMPDIDTLAYSTDGVFARYSHSHDGWVVWADGLTLYFWAYTESGSTTNNWRAHTLLCSGDYDARFANSYPYFAIGRESTSGTGFSYQDFLALNSARFAQGSFVSVDPDGISGGIAISLRGLGGSTDGNASPQAAPLAKTDGSYVFAPAEISAPASMGLAPGKLRGAYTCGSDLSAFYDLADSDGNLIHREVDAGWWMIPAYLSGSNTSESSRGTILFDVQGPW